MKAMAKVLGDLQVKNTAYQNATKQLSDAKIFSFKISDRAMVESDRELLRNFQKTNEDLRDCLMHLGERMRAELQAANVPPLVRDAVMVRFDSEQREVSAIQLKIRDDDRALGQTALAVLELLDTNWGRWERKPPTDQLVFRDGSNATAFNELVKKVQTLSDEERDLQKQLGERMRGQMNHSQSGGAGASTPGPHSS
jgi:hypothetical protein